MREIKFRAWNKERKEMFVSPGEIEHLGSWFDSHLPGAIADVKNIEIMQHTGLKDKNGKEIYEGDVLRGWGTYNLLVSIEDGHTITKWFDNEPVEDYLINTYIEDDGLEVIGNIYENTELLEVGND